MASAVWNLSPGLVSLTLMVVILGGVVRGFGGFGSSMVWVAGLSVALPPRTVIPTVLMLEILASMQMLRQVWRDTHWASLRWLLIGASIGLPFGTWALATLDERPMRILIVVIVLSAAVAMVKGWHRDHLPGPGGGVATGVASGALDGAFALGGPPAILMYFSSKRHVVASRASLVVFFLYTDLLGTVSAGVGGLISWQTLAQTAAIVPLALAGVGIGSFWFHHTETDSFRKYVLWILVALSGLTLAQTILAF